MTDHAEPIPDFMALWDYNDPAATAERFERVLARVEASENEAAHAELQTQIARTYSLRGAFDRANEILDEVESMLTDDAPRPRIRYLLERGRTFNSAGDPERACLLFDEAWTLAKSSGEDGLAVDAAHMLGIAAPHEDRMRWNLAALALAEASDDPDAHRWCGSLSNNIGWTHFEQAAYDEALDVFERCLAWQTAQGKAPEIRIARWSIARTHRALGATDKALAEQRALYETMGDEPDGYVYEEIAECLHTLGDGDAARWFGLAHEVLAKDEWLRANESARLERMARLAGGE